VPNSSERTGDLSGVASSLTGTVHGDYWANLLSQKLGYPVFQGEPYYTPGRVNSSQCVLPNARIPKTAWSAPGRKLLQYTPLSNNSNGTFSTAAYNQTLRDEKGTVLLDANTRWGSLSAYYFLDDYSLNNPYPSGQGGASIPGFNASTTGRAQLLSLGATKAIGGIMANEFHFSYVRDDNNVHRDSATMERTPTAPSNRAMVAIKGIKRPDCPSKNGSRTENPKESWAK
jgi:hypothetical protein